MHFYISFVLEILIIILTTSSSDLYEMLHIFANWITDNPLWRIINLSVLPKLSSITIFEYKSAEHAGSDAFDYCEIINFKEELCKLKNGIKLEEKKVSANNV